MATKLIASNFEFLTLAKIIRNNVPLTSLSALELDCVIEQGFSALLYQSNSSQSIQADGSNMAEGSLFAEGSSITEGSSAADGSSTAEGSSMVESSNEALRKVRQIALINEATAIVRLEALRELFDLSEASKLSFLLLKGAAFSYLLYQTPGCRPSSDMDVFIDEADVELVKTVFVALGYSIDVPVEKSMLSFQFAALKSSGTGHTLVFDIHYRINNNSRFERYFNFHELMDNAIAIPALDERAKTLCYADAFVFACVHLQGHLQQGEPVKTIWLYDIHLLLHALSKFDVDKIIKLFERFKVDDLGNVCRYWTDKTQSIFNSEPPSSLKLALNDYAEIEHKQHSGPLRLLWQQVAYLPSVRSKILFIRQLFFPSKKRLRQKYPDSSMWLPLLYMRRILFGFYQRITKNNK